LTVDVVKQGTARIFKNYFSAFTVLKSCPRPFWVVQLINLLDGIAYFSMLTVSTLYLSETIGFDDKSAANIWAMTAALYTGVGVIAGFIGDWLGIKRTLQISVIMLVASRLAICATTLKSVVVPSLFVIQAGTAIMTPILISATKRYTTKKTQSAGFSMLYFLMNIGAFLGNFVLDPLRALPWSNRTVFMMGSVLSITCWLAILLLWRKDSVNRPSGNEGPDDIKLGNKNEDVSKREPIWHIVWSVIRESAFWRFMLFLVILVGVRLVFEHQNQIYPKYYLRTIGPEAPVGRLSSINGLIICFGIIISTPIVARFKLFNVMFFGICVSAVSMLFMAIPPTWCMTIFGVTLSQAYMIIVICQIVTFAVGEVIWSPRLYEYTAAIAPEGREASYMGLSYLPMFFARFAEGPLAGWLLTSYCPPDISDELISVPYTQSPQFMCLILAGIAIASPLLIIALRGVIQKGSRLEKSVPYQASTTKSSS